MIRQVLCRGCGDEFDLHKEDRHTGFMIRKRYLVCAGPPKGHGISVNGVFEPMTEIHCDGCNLTITGEVAVAVTHWRFDLEDEPGDWESDYGNIITKEAANLAAKLKGQEIK